MKCLRCMRKIEEGGEVKDNDHWERVAERCFKSWEEIILKKEIREENMLFCELWYRVTKTLSVRGWADNLHSLIRKKR